MPFSTEVIIEILSIELQKTIIFGSFMTEKLSHFNTIHRWINMYQFNSTYDL